MQGQGTPTGKYRSGILRAFVFAFHGLKLLLVTQRNAQVHAVLSVIAVALGAWLRLTAMEWIALVLAMGGVWVAMLASWLCGSAPLTVAADANMPCQSNL